MLLPFFQTSQGFDYKNSLIFNSFYCRVVFGRCWGALRNLGGGGVNPPPSVRQGLTSRMYTFVPALKTYNLLTKKYGIQEISYLIVLSCYILIEIFVCIAICYCDKGETGNT